MPPRIRTRATKLQKENIEVVKKNKIKSHENGTKSTRKVLADKTNSLSDNDSTNSSIKPRLKVDGISTKAVKTLKKSDLKVITSPDKTAKDAKFRSKRSCRVKTVKDTPTSPKPTENLSESPFKTPSKDLDSSLVANRPKRICRLPSKFDDHFISPNKLLPVQPCHASTPIAQKNAAHAAQITKSVKTAFNSAENINTSQNSHPKQTPPVKSNTQRNQARPIKTIKVNEKLSKSNHSVDKISPDNNNNGKKVLPRRVAKLKTKKTSPQANKITPFTKRLINKSASFRILEDRSEKSKNLDVYEFTFDPNDEPTPQKKKKKKTVRKKPSKPKTVTIPRMATVPKSKYEDNIAKALTNLKTKIKPQHIQTENIQNPPTQIISNTQAVKEVPSTQITKPLNKPIPQNNTNISKPTNESAKTSLHESNYASIRVEDIAADFEMDESHNNLNYSPVNTPLRPKTPEVSKDTMISKDPLNLQDGSFFDAPPVASSSMNLSRVRGDPLASPWRVEFGSLPFKWHANTYVKPNMTPAVECSFINAEDVGKNKHVYTNMIPDEPLPQIEDPPALKQTSIISFMKEVAERSAKKKRKRSVSPTKASYFFDANPEFGFKTPKKAKKCITDSTANKSNEKSDENISDSSNKSVSPSKNKKKDKEITYFGFDESEMDQENMSPEKVPNTRSKRVLRPRGVLQECNQGPTRAVIPGKAKLTSSEVVKHLYDQLKSADDVPVFPENETANEPTEKQMTNIEEPVQDNDDAESVHLFEDIELIHHLKPHRKSYSKPKKVAFQGHSNSDSDAEDERRVEANSSDEDDLADLSFRLPNVKEKKVTKKKSKKKKLLSKKEEKEVEEWAAGFNSMCEDIEEFPLVVE